jgi:GDP-L-fucose synthase
VELVAKTVDFRGEIAWDSTKPDGQPRRCLDVTRADKLLGFRALTPLEEGLRETVAWFEKNRETARLNHGR